MPVGSNRTYLGKEATGVLASNWALMERLYKQAAQGSIANESIQSKHAQACKYGRGQQ
jgi:hypothetical protein